jgi:hypothetical protein
MELRKTARRIREEHETETTQHGVEGAIVEAERLAGLDRDRDVRRWGEALARYIDHGLGDVGSCDMTVRADRGESALGRDPCTRRRVEHPLPQLKTCRPQQEREEVGRDMGEAPVIPASGPVVE